MIRNKEEIKCPHCGYVADVEDTRCPSCGTVIFEGTIY